ncbi:nucleotidyltransferase substrate binding protein [Bacillus niameyensis]|uniref:nucleotidyltransferase substrate binding protein n=1 Tax=Bacillus niameyensis TaxID=1522308 RepID=UPI00078385DE|nr:nucleotidyltransferase substrate binding protein [Bacillus niameyensis]
MNRERLYEKLDDYKRASTRLKEATKIKVDSDIVYDGVIQRFEFTFELSWKLMKTFLEYTGITEMKSPRATIREANSYGLIEDGEQWIDMMVDRNKTSHIYDEEEARLIYEKIKNYYCHLLSDLYSKLEQEIMRIK